MTLNLKDLEARLRARICMNCVRCTREGTCSLPMDRTCALFGRLSDIARVVEQTHSAEMGPYEDSLRLEVCRNCLEDDHACCPLRDGLDCALDLYFPIVVDEIEQAVIGDPQKADAIRAA